MVKEIPRYVKEIDAMYHEVATLEDKILKIVDKDKHNELTQKLTTLKQNMADFVSDANIDGFLGPQKIDKKTQEEINMFNSQYRKQMQQMIEE
jgi:hypothetical protein